MDVLQNDHPWLILLVLGKVPPLQGSKPGFFFLQYLTGTSDSTCPNVHTKLMIF